MYGILPPHGNLLPSGGAMICLARAQNATTSPINRIFVFVNLVVSK